MKSSQMLLHSLLYTDKTTDEEFGLSRSEAEHFSKYCGYDLTHD